MNVVLIAILLIAMFFVGFVLGLIIPFILKKYVKEIFSNIEPKIELLKNTKEEDREELNNNNVVDSKINLTDEIIDEWVNGGTKK